MTSSSKTTLQETVRIPDLTEWVRVAVAGSPDTNWRVQLSAVINSGLTHAWFATLAVGDTFGTFPPSTNISAYNSDMHASGPTANDSGEQVAGFFGFVGVTNSPTSYQKDGIFSWIFTADPSVPGSITRDAVGGDFRGTIFTGNLTGRAYGAFIQAASEAGADGQQIGAEIAVSNMGADEPNPLAASPKFNIVLDADPAAANSVTAAFYLNGGSNAVSTWHYIMYVPQFCIASGGYLINYVNTFAVDATGNMHLSVAALVNAVNDAAAAAAGAVVGQVYRNGSVLMVRVA